MKRFKSLFLLLSAMLMLSTCATPALAFADEGAEQGQETTPSQALTPEGNMALVDDIDGDAAGDKQFIVVQSRGGHYFYIIIDHASEGENIVHFLNQVDEADLLSLIEQEEQAPAVCSCTDKCHAGAVNTACEICAVNMSECAGVEPEPEKPDTPPDEPDTPEEPETPEEKGGNPLMIVALLAVLGAGGAVAYLKFFKKKPNVKGHADLDDYDYGADDDLDDAWDNDTEYEPEKDTDTEDDEPEDE